MLNNRRIGCDHCSTFGVWGCQLSPVPEDMPVPAVPEVQELVPKASEGWPVWRTVNQPGSTGLHSHSMGKEVDIRNSRLYRFYADWFWLKRMDFAERLIVVLNAYSLPPKRYSRVYLVLLGLHGSIQVQFIDIQLLETQLKFSGFFGWSERRQNLKIR